MLQPLKEGDKVIVTSLPNTIRNNAMVGVVGVITFYSPGLMIGVNINDGLGNWYFYRDNLELIRKKELTHA